MRRFLLYALILFYEQTWVHAAPPTEPCPHDSVQVADICKCDPQRCSKPPCPFELNILTNGTDTPGQCCIIYSCDGCPNETLINGKCPCAPGAILNSKGECECVDKHKSLINNECVCNSDLCELPQICGKNYVSVSETTECCTETKCIKCPNDSYATSNNDETVEDKCVCYPCLEKACELNETVVIMQHGSSFPGSCCDMYKCEKVKPKGEKVEPKEEKVEPKGEKVEPKEEKDEAKCEVGEEWDTPDGEKCKCQKTQVAFCTKPTDEESFHSCHNDNNVYKHNESWMLDSCTNCTCVNGETKCIAHMCEISEGHLNKPECQPLNCSKVCPDGFKLNKRGCKICKCNYPYRYDDILQKYNITKNQLKDIIDDYYGRSKTETSLVVVTSTAATNVSEKDHITTPFTDADGCQSWGRVLWFILGFCVAITCTGILCGIKLLNRKKKGSYDTNPRNYERMDVMHTLFNNNYIGNENKDESNVKGSV